jgi:hypothetical protein
MRSELVFDAMANISNRFLLTMLAANATRKLHRPNTRIQETANDVLVRLGHTKPIENAQPIQGYAYRGTAQSELNPCV